MKSSIYIFFIHMSCQTYYMYMGVALDCGFELVLGVQKEIIRLSGTKLLLSGGNLLNVKETIPE